MTFDPFFSCHMLVWFQVNNFRIRVGKKALGHFMTHNATVSYRNCSSVFCMNSCHVVFMFHFPPCALRSDFLINITHMIGHEWTRGLLISCIHLMTAFCTRLYTLDKKSLNGHGKSMVTVLQIKRNSLSNEGRI